MNKKFGIAGALIIPLFYIIPLIFTGNPDFIVFKLGVVGFPVWLTQWIGFALGGWVFATILTILLLSVVGYITGCMVAWLSSKVFYKNYKNNRT